MENTTIIDKFLQFEEDNNLLEANIEGFYWWRYIRLRIYRSLIPKTNKKQYDLSSIRFDKINNPLKLIWNSIRKNPIYINDSKDIIFISSPRRIKDGNSYKCLYTDAISEHFIDNSIVMESPFEYKHFVPAYTENLYYLDSIAIKRKIASNLVKFSRKTKKEFRIISKNLYKLVLANFNVNYSENFIYSILITTYANYIVSKKEYYKIISKIRPKVVVLENAYHKMSLIEVCKKLNVTVIELQHGLISYGHIAYNYSRKMPLTTFPDYLLLFSEYWNRAKFPIDDKCIKGMGYPYLESMLEKYPPHKSSDIINIVVISQPGLYVELSELVKDFLVENKKYSNSKFKIIIKLHPIEYNDKDSINAWSFCANDENIEIVTSNEYPIHYYFSHADIQVGMYSTALFEGLAYGLNTYILRYPNAEAHIMDMVESNYATIIDNGKELYQMICNRKPKNIINKYFMPNGIENIVEFIKSFI